MATDNETAEILDLSSYNTYGFCPSYPLGRHRHETLADVGCHEARTDWMQYIGPATEFGGCNPLNGNFTALVLPLCKPERLQLVAYVLEYAFLHDKFMEEVDASAYMQDSDEFALGTQESHLVAVKQGRQQIQAKMMLGLTSTDRACAERVLGTWKTMLSTTLRDKLKDFTTLDEYLDFRIIDTGAPFVESIMLFGMGMTLTTDEDELLAGVVRPCYAALALANDYFSFDQERQEAQGTTGSKPLNAVWLYMQWRGVCVTTAKRLVREATNRCEQQFLERCDKFRADHAPIPDKLDRYLRGLSIKSAATLSGV